MGSSPPPGKGLVCPKCGGALAFLEGDKVSCQACHVSFRLQKPTPKPSDPAPLVPKPDDDWFDQIKPVEDHQKNQTALEAMRRAQPKVAAEPVAVEKEYEVPKWPMWQGVWTFPWYRSTLAQWLVASALLCALGNLIRLAAMFLLMGVIIQIVAAGFIGISILGYLAGLFGATIIETAHGAEQIEDWPKFKRAELIDNILAPGTAAVYVVLLFAGLHYALPSMELDWLSAVSMFIFLYPVVLLSILEADSVFVPVSLTILKTIVATPSLWFLFWAQTTLLLCLMVGFSFLALLWAASGDLSADSAFLSRAMGYLLLLLSPILASAIFIYGRLIGRIAWCGGQATGVERTEIDYRQMRTQDPSVFPNRGTHADSS
jgi:hypothetical protein